MIETVYVSGPLTSGGLYANTRRAVMLGNELRLKGFLPFVPHAMSMGEFVCPLEYEEAMALDFRWIARLDALLRCPKEWGPSPGADREVAHALAIGKPVFYDVLSLEAARKMHNACKHPENKRNKEYRCDVCGSDFSYEEYQVRNG